MHVLDVQNRPGGRRSPSAPCACGTTGPPGGRSRPPRASSTGRPSTQPWRNAQQHGGQRHPHGPRRDADVGDAPMPSSGGLAGVVPGAAGPPKNVAYWDAWVTAGRDPLQGPDHVVPDLERGQPSDFWTGTPAQMADLTKRAYDIIKNDRSGGDGGLAQHRHAPRCAVQQVLPGVPRGNCGTRLAGRRLVRRAHLPGEPGPPTDRAVLARSVGGHAQRCATRRTCRCGTPRTTSAWPAQARPIPTGHHRTAGSRLDRANVSRLASPRHQPRVLVRVGAPERPARHPDEHRHTAALALKTLERWIVGTTFNGCTGTAVVNCSYTSPTQGQMRIMWAEAGTATVPVPSGYSQKCTLLGGCAPLAAGSRLRLSGPVLFRN